MSVEQCECAEMRTRGLRSEVTGFDNRFFIPLYTLLSGLVVAWAWSHARLCTEQSPRIVRGTAIALCVATAVLVFLDLRENTKLMAILDHLDRIGVAGVIGDPSAADVTSLDTMARKVRRASCLKWGATALWALALSAVFHAVLRWARVSEAPSLWGRLTVTVWATALLAAAITGTGQIRVLFSGRISIPITWAATRRLFSMGVWNRRRKLLEKTTLIWFAMRNHG